MEFKDVVFGRRSIRRYTQEPVSDEDLQYILDAGLYAPSGVDLQPWYFVVIRSKEQMEKLASFTGRMSDQLTDVLRGRFQKHPEVAEESLRFIRQLGGAPVCILVFQMREEYSKKPETIVQSIGAAIENMCLAACDRGLGSCWMTAPLESLEKEAMREAFAPDKGPIMAMVTIGHPDMEPKAPRRKEGRYVII